MIAAGALGMFLAQSAMNAGRLLAVQPGLTLADPVLAVLWGVLAFHEKVKAGWSVVPEAISLVIVAAAVLALSRSPQLADSARGG